MNGHCDFHTFERAVDVCDLCYGDLCRTCALALKGRKDRVCKDCALAVSGIRGSGKPEIRGDRRTVKERRKAYAEAEPPEDYFQYFDTDLPVEALVTQVPPPASQSDREKAATQQSIADAADGNSAAEMTDGTGIKRLLGRFKPNDPDINAGEFVAIDEILGDDEKNPDGSDDGKDADAVSQLADIRRRGRAARVESKPLPDPAGVPPVPDADSDVDSGPEPSPIHAEPVSSKTPAVPSSLLPPGDDDPAHGDVAAALSSAAPDASPVVSDPLSGVSDGAEPNEPVVVATTGPQVDQPKPGEGPPSATDEQPTGGSEDVAATFEPQQPPSPADDHLRHDPVDPSDEVLPSDFDDLFTADDRPEHTSVDHEPLPHGERRRTLRPVGEFPATTRADQVPGHSTEPDPFHRGDHLSDLSPRLRDLVSDLSNGSPQGPPAENPFLKKSRVVSEPDAVPDFSLDPFSQPTEVERHRTDPDAAPKRSSVPAPASPSSRTDFPSPDPAPPPDLPSPDPAASVNQPPSGSVPIPERFLPSSLAAPDPEADPIAEPVADTVATQLDEPDPLGTSDMAAVHPLARAYREERPLLPEPPPIDDVLPAIDELFGSAEPSPPPSDSTSAEPDHPAHFEPDPEPRWEATPLADVEQQPEPRWEPTPLADVEPQPEPAHAPTPLADVEQQPEPRWEPTPLADVEPQPEPQPEPALELGGPLDDLLPPGLLTPIGDDSSSFPPLGLVDESGYPAPGSTVLPTADDSAHWTVVDDVPDMDGSTPKERADTDARGSWIPPALRGMAPDAEEAGQRLPRRRS